LAPFEVLVDDITDPDLRRQIPRKVADLKGVEGESDADIGDRARPAHRRAGGWRSGCS